VVGAHSAVMYGISYLGFTVWACVGATLPGKLQAAIPVSSQSRVHSVAFAQGGLSLELIVLWFFVVMRVLAEHSPLAQARTWVEAWREMTISRAHMHTPLSQLDRVLLGKEVAFMQQALAHPAADDPFWQTRDKLCDLTTQSWLPPMHLVTCWFDFFASECLRDYEAVRALQPFARLTVGAHDHWGLLHVPHMQRMYRCVLGCLDEHLAPVAPNTGPCSEQAPFSPFHRPLPPLPPAAGRRGGRRVLESFIYCIWL